MQSMPRKEQERTVIICLRLLLRWYAVEGNFLVVCWRERYAFHYYAAVEFLE